MPNLESLTIHIKSGEKYHTLKVDRASMVRDYEELDWFIKHDSPIAETVRYHICWLDEGTNTPIRITTERGYQTFLRANVNADAVLCVLAEPIYENNPLKYLKMAGEFLSNTCFETGKAITGALSLGLQMIKDSN